MASQPRFILEEPLHGPGVYVLDRQESHHAVNVLRLKRDDAIVVFDGMGNYAEAIITEAHKNGVAVRVDGVYSEKHLPLKLTIATAVPKGKRWQILVEKCTELGVDRLVPMLSERSVVKPAGDNGKWRRWIVEAAKQCRRAWVPEITDPMLFADVVAAAKRDNAILMVADPCGDSLGMYQHQLEHILNVVVLIGPEGGLAEDELEICRREGAKFIRLSPYTLRIETAAATVCAIIRDVL